MQMSVVTSQVKLLQSKSHTQLFVRACNVFFFLETLENNNMREYKPHPNKQWTEAAMKAALNEHRELGTDQRELSHKYNIPRTTIQSRLKGDLQKVGRKGVFSVDEEIDLRSCISELAELGFAMTLSDIAELVENYVAVNNHQRGKKIFKRGGRIGYPGPDWLSSFLKRYDLSLKEATKLSAPRYNATKNSFIIYNFYELLEKVLDKHPIIAERPDLLWNCDESGLPHEPKKCKVVSPRGQPTLQVIHSTNQPRPHGLLSLFEMRTARRKELFVSPYSFQKKRLKALGTRLQYKHHSHLFLSV